MKDKRDGMSGGEAIASVVAMDSDKKPDSGQQLGNSAPAISIAELLGMEDVRRDDIVEGGVLPRGGTLMIMGAPKAGKSFLVQDLAVAAASGKPFLGFPTKQTNVLILSGEGGLALLKERFAKMGEPDGQQ